MAEFDYPLSERVKGLKAKRQRINKDLHLNFERNRILTDYFMKHENQYPRCFHNEASFKVNKYSNYTISLITKDENIILD